MGTRVTIMAGGTGGHVYPALAVAEDLRGRGCEVTWIGTAVGLEARLVPEAGIPFDRLRVSGVRGKSLVRRVLAPLMLAGACAEAAAILRRRRPHVVLGLGGFASGPGGVMARILGIPVVIHEQNRVPGTTNRWLARIARRVLEAFPQSFSPSVGAICTGNPLRAALAQAEPGARREPSPPLRLLVFGGSLGAKVLNEILPAALAGDASWDVRHQTGAAMRDETVERYRKAGVSARVDAYIDDMVEAYAWADLVVCRAGAMTVSELAAVGLPAILVPFPHAIDDHQTANARYFSDAGAGVCLPQSELTPERLATELRALREDPARLKAMAGSARALARLDAAPRVADIVLQEASA
ncbi:MAG: undecaprenyldiphospho-muramoylpentapeptide beta-N-acetylglucosaminyltransferase [Methylotetracoccus sp.]